MTSLLDTTSGVPDSSPSVVDAHQSSSDIPADGLSWKTGYSPTPLRAMTSSTDGFENVSFAVDLYDPPFATMVSESDWCSQSSQSSQHIITKQQQHPMETKQSTSLIEVLRQQADVTVADQKTKSLDEDLTSVFVPHMVFSCIIMLTGVGSLFGCFGFAFAVLAARDDEHGRHEKSHIWSRLSFICSTVGFIVFLGVVITVLVLALVGLIYTDPE